MRPNLRRYFFMPAQGTPKPTQKADNRRSGVNNFVRSLSPLLDPSAEDPGNDGELALGANSRNGGTFDRGACSGLLTESGSENSVMGTPSLAQPNGGLSLRPKSGRRSSEAYACNPRASSCNLMKAEKLFSHELVFRAASRHMQAGFKCGASLKLARPPQKAPAKMGLEIRKRQRP